MKKKLTLKGINIRAKWDMEITDHGGGEYSVLKLPILWNHSDPKFDGMDPQTCSILTKPALAAVMGLPENEAIEMVDNNSGLVGKRYVVSEYVGREGASENLTPDWAIDGFTHEELRQLISWFDSGDIDKFFAGTHPYEQRYATVEEVK